jgi:urease gamma subunit
MFLGARANSVAASGLRSGAQDLMHSALKPSSTMSLADSNAAVNTLLNEGINVSRGGADKLRGRIDVLNQGIKDAIGNSDATVSRDAVASRLNPVEQQASLQVNPAADVAAIQSAREQFLNHPLATSQIPVGLAQDMKQGTYRALGDQAYGQITGASKTAQKALARGLKEEIANAVPEVSPLNARESQLLTALDPLEHRVMIELNRNPAGLSWLAHSPGKFAAFMADKSGLFKSLVARMMNTSASAFDGAPVSGIAVSQGAGLLPRQDNTGLLGQ